MPCDEMQYHCIHETAGALERTGIASAGDMEKEDPRGAEMIPSSYPAESDGKEMVCDKFGERT